MGGADDIASAGVGPEDFVLGIATSGTTPYVHGALIEARRRRAALGFLSCTPPPERISALGARLITPLVGPEVVAGSTRMKAGTATKLVLNTITTAAMIRSGRVYRNLMVDLRARSAKLVDRAIRIVAHASGIDRERARRFLIDAGGSAKTAIAMCLMGESRANAERSLDAADGMLGLAVERHGRAGLGLYDAYPETPDRPSADAPGSDSVDVPELIARLSRAPRALLAADREGREAESEGRVPVRRDGWTAAQHAAHLLEFERECVGPRVRAYRAGGRLEFESWEARGRPEGGDDPLRVVVDRWTAERERSLGRLAGAEPEVWARSAALGEERPTLYQFLRGVAQHDAAHALRIEERVHPRLLDPVGSGEDGG